MVKKKKLSNLLQKNIENPRFFEFFKSIKWPWILKESADKNIKSSGLFQTLNYHNFYWMARTKIL
jgi:hypothetical protein